VNCLRKKALLKNSLLKNSRIISNSKKFNFTDIFRYSKIESSYIPVLSSIICFFIPLKLSITYLFLIPVILIWLSNNLSILKFKFTSFELLALFFTIAFVSGLAGFNPSASLIALTSFFFFSLWMLVVGDLVKIGHHHKLLKFLLLGQSISCAYSILSMIYWGRVPHFFLGEVSQSGQLGLTVVLAIGLMSIEYEVDNNNFLKKNIKIFSFILAIGLSWLTFNARFQNSLVKLSYATIVIVFYLILSTKYYWQIYKLPNIPRIYLGFIVVPLLVTTLFINLKRGPWVGVVSGLTLMFLMRKQKILILSLILASAIALFFSPIRTRLMQSSQHFFIYGGRSEIWSIGKDLSLNYPLGIGYDNARVLQVFSNEVPPELKHFHSNILNLIVEVGWIGALVFVWWIGNVILNCIKRYNQNDYLIIGVALLSWQIAGLVEYNLGDREVMLIAFTLIGLYLGLNENKNITVK
jgi:hypothetical protein